MKVAKLIIMTLTLLTLVSCGSETASNNSDGSSNFLQSDIPQVP